MKILVTGGCGYVGSSLVPALLKHGYSVVVVDTMWFGNKLAPHANLTVVQEDIRNIDNIHMDGVDKVIHLANIANDPTGDLDAKLVWEVNALATMGLVEKSISTKVTQFIYASSGSVYGVKDELEVTEDLSLVPISDYNKTKMISERTLLSYAEKLCIQIVRPATVCGHSPRMRLDLSVNMLTFQALKNGVITVFGGSQERPNIHMKDMVRVYLHFLEKPELRGVYNAGFENISILELARRISKSLDTKIEIRESNDPRSYRLSSRKLEATGFERQYGIDDGIKEVIDAFRSGLLLDEDANYNIRTMMKIAKK